jgi:hypothetical protein
MCPFLIASGGRHVLIENIEKEKCIETENREDKE